MLGSKNKQPGDTLDYDIDYTQWMPEGDSLQTASASVLPTGLTINNVEVIPPLVKVWLSGGDSGVTYKVTVIAVTNLGRTKEEEFQIRCRNT